MTRWHNRGYSHGAQGAVFLISMVVLTVLLLLGASLIERAQTSVFRASVESRSTRSFHLAEAAIQKAMWGLNQPNGWLLYTGESSTTLGGGSFALTVSPPPSQRGVFTDRLFLLATGYLPGPNGQQRYPVRVRVVASKDPRYFAYAVFGSEKVNIGNGTVTVLTDSYTSNEGGYGGGNTAWSGDIGTNATGANAVEILPQGTVNGSISVGAGATDPSACVNNKGTINGTISALPAQNLLPSIGAIPTGVIELGDVWLEADQVLTLNEGSYHMTDLDIFGNAKVVCNGKVVIYLDETSDAATPDIRIGGNGIVNTSQIPANLAIYCKNDVTNIAIGGNGAFYGGIYAPNAHITLNAGDVYGSLVGRTVTLNGANANVHYDEALRDNSNPRAIIRSWQVL